MKIKQTLDKLVVSLCLASTLSFGAVNCGSETDGSDAGVPADAGSSNYDSGSNKDTGVGYDSGSVNPDNKPPILKLKYSFDLKNWTDLKNDGEVITILLKDYKGFMEVDPCESYDIDGKIVEIYTDWQDEGSSKINTLTNLLDDNKGCYSGGGGCEEGKSACTTHVTLRAKDDKGAESRLKFTLEVK